MNDIKILDLGCGMKKEKNSIGLDKFPYSGVDVIYDLESGKKFPFEDCFFDKVNAFHLLEHINNKDFRGKDIIYHIFGEVYRVLKPNGIFHIKVPYFKSFIAVGVLEHKRFFSSKTFMWFEKMDEFNKRECNVEFGVHKLRFNYLLGEKKHFKLINKIINPLINFNHNFYELLLSNLLPCGEIEVWMVKKEK